VQHLTSGLRVVDFSHNRLSGTSKFLQVGILLTLFLKNYLSYASFTVKFVCMIFHFNDNKNAMIISSAACINAGCHKV